MQLLHPILQLLILVKEQLRIIRSLCIIVRGYQFLQLYLELLILQRILLDLTLFILQLPRCLLQLVLGFLELVAALLEHVGEELDLLILIGYHLHLLVRNDLALGICHGGLLFVDHTQHAILLLPLEEHKVLLLQHMVLLLQLTNLDLQLLYLLYMLLVYLKKGLIIGRSFVSKLGLPLLNLNNAPEEAVVLLEQRRLEVRVLHHVDVLHLSYHRLILSISQILQRRQIQNLL